MRHATTVTATRYLGRGGRLLALVWVLALSACAHADAPGDVSADTHPVTATAIGGIGSAPRATATPGAGESAARGGGDSQLVGSWQAYSARFFYDQGGAGTVDTTVTRQLLISADGTWRFGTTNGRWSLSQANQNDWQRWNVPPYGPTRKITLTGWSGGVADGPIEESGGRIDFLWVIYHTTPPVVTAPGTVWVKYGHAQP
jgi:hypothetical protein